MKFFDELYGEYELDPIFAELIESDAMQRLKNVHMAGAAYLMNGQWNETRYEHSLGVALLIKRLGGSQAEQIAGLLHDISHTAFSHVVDLALKNNHEDYHERIKLKVIQQTQLPAILQKYGYSYEELLMNDSQWPILEKEAPRLCGDRIDYTLREIHRYFDVSLTEIETFLNDLTVVNQEIVVQTVQSAEWFVENYYKIVLDFFYHPLNVYSYEIVAKLISLGLGKAYITEADLLLTDSYLLEKLKEQSDLEVKQLFNQLTNKVKLLVATETDYDIHQKKKLRLIDPTVIVNGELIAVSAVSKKVQQLNQAAFDFSSKGIYLKVNSTTAN